MASASRVIGRSLARVDGKAKAAGRARYPQDRPFAAEGLHAVTVRAPVAAARLVAVDVAAALRTRGVVRVLTAADVRGSNRFGLLEPDQPVLVEDCIRAASDVVALVVATSERAARAGARRVGLRLESTRLLVDPERACDRDAVVVHPERAAVADHPNVVGAARIRRGAIGPAFARAAAVVESVYETSWVEHAFLAPEAGIAVPKEDGTLTLHVATQWPEADLRQAATALGEPLDRLRLVQDAIGGAFGGREDVSIQILLLLAARATGRPVRMVWDRAESIRGHGKRHPFRIRHRLAADRDGRLLAADIDILADAGGYASTSRAVVANAVEQACGPYVIPAVDVRGRAVFTHNPVTGAFRGFGVNQVCFAMEQQMNKLAAALGLAPATLRQRNFVRTGARLATGSRVATADGLPKSLAAATARARRQPLPRPRDGWVHGRGIASALKNVGYGFGFDDHATARVRMAPDGGVVVAIGAAEVGQGITTVLTQIAAETLRVAPEHVRVVWEDSATAPEAGSTSASRQTLVSGNAVRGACERLVRLLAARGSRAARPADGITTSYTWRVPPTQPLGHPRPTRHAHTYGWSTVVADVAVEVATGRVRVGRVVVAVDAGRVINPALLRGQIEGGVVMGQGYALLEHCAVRDGMPVGLRLDACNLPTAVDAVPAIEIVTIESAEPCGPFGARGVGEIAMIPIVPAITAAIHAACGVWVDAIPAAPERVHAALVGSRSVAGRGNAGYCTE